MYEWFVLYIVDPDADASVNAFTHRLSLVHFFSLTQSRHSTSQIRSFSDPRTSKKKKKEDVTDVDVNFIQTYAHVQRLTKYKNGSMYLYDHMTFRAHHGWRCIYE